MSDSDNTRKIVYLSDSDDEDVSNKRGTPSTVKADSSPPPCKRMNVVEPRMEKQFKPAKVNEIQQIEPICIPLAKDAIFLHRNLALNQQAKQTSVLDRYAGICQESTIRPNKSSVLVLKNMVTADGLDEHLEGKIRQKCQKYGNILNMEFIRKEYYSEKMTIYVRFEKPVQAEKARTALDGQLFEGQIVIANLTHHKDEATQTPKKASTKTKIQCEILSGEFPGIHILFLQEKTLACLTAEVTKGMHRFLAEKPTFRIIDADPDADQIDSDEMLQEAIERKGKLLRILAY